MEISEFMIWKALVMVALAFIWGIYCGFTGRPLGREPRDSPTDAQKD
jgi:hypothetical protein